MLRQSRQLTRMRFIHVHPMAILVLLLALTASNVFAVDVPWTGNGTNNGYCESSNQNPGVPVGMQLWLFVLTSPADSGPYQLTATFAPGGTITVTGTPRGNGAVHFEVLTTAGAQVVSAVATGGTSKSNLVVSHCDVNNPALVVSKDAHTSYSRTYTWAIEKSVSPSVLDMFVNDSGTATYNVSVTRTGYYDSDWSVSGNIYIHNPSSVDATLASVTDDISGVGSVAVSCPGNVVPAGSTMTCSYSSSLPDGSSRVNTATVTTTGTVAGGSGQADITFGAPSAEYLTSVSVVDSMAGSLGSFDGSGSVSYSRTFDCYGDAGTHDNTATIEQTGQSDSASVQVNCYELEVSKTAVTSGGGGGHWDIEKWVEPETLDLFVGDSADVQYFIEVTHTSGGDGDWNVSGQITVYNPSPLTANLTAVSDLISDFGPVPVDCPTLSIAPYDTLVCTYSAELPDGQERLNTAVATLQNTPGGTTDFTGSAAIVFEDPGGGGTEPVDVVDTLMGVLAEDITSDFATSYPYTYTCGESDTYPNTASIISGGGTVLDSDTAYVQVNCHALEVTKTAVTSGGGGGHWEIEKWVEPETLDLFVGDSADVQYYVQVTHTSGEEGGWAVSGEITIYNPSPLTANLDSVSDFISDFGEVAVDCPTLTIAPYDALVCTYSTELPDGQERLNTAVATLQNTPGGTTDFTGSAAIVFEDPGGSGNEPVDVIDTLMGVLAEDLTSDWDTTYPYTYTCGESDTYPNTASIISGGGAVLDSDTANVQVNCHALEVTKTAETAFTRTWSWSIDKSADHSELVLATGETAVVTYTVSVDATPADSDWAVTGTIDVHNPAPIDAVIEGVSDVIDGVGSAAVDCDVTFPYTLAAGDTLQCTYSAELPDNQTRVNGATATLQNTPSGTTDFSGTADVVFGDTPASEVDECIVVSDTFAGDLGTVCAGDGLPYTFATYTRDVGPYETCGPQDPLDNTAAFATNDSGATGEDTVTIPVDVTCDEGADGCTPGYWKNHTSNWGPTGYLPGDSVSTMFSATPAPFASKTLLQALKLKGGSSLNGAREILLRAAVAAMLNASDPRLDYALSPAEVQALVNAVIAGNNRAAIINLAALLDGYNNAGCPLN